MFKSFKTVLFLIIPGMLLSFTVYSQADSLKPFAYEDLSFRDLLNVKIVSVSKKVESLFDAPLSAAVVTKEDIRRSGSTSIMEALRLVPGMIVRELSNGNYDIHLRGMDNVPPSAPFEGSATTTLVMINGRPIYNYLKGGTFWETLPVDINDVEKIEVVRGPSGALYGPNAVSGVINIITRHTEKNGLYALANSTMGSHHTFINTASVGYQINKFSALASANYQERDRTQTSYFELNRNRWLDHPSYFLGLLGDTFSNVNQLYPEQELAMRKYAGNIFLNYNASTKAKISFAAGTQHSMVQTITTENGITPLTTTGSNSYYADLKATWSGFAAQLSYNRGVQNMNFNPGNKYDFETFDANVEYNYLIGKLALKPGLSYRSAIYDDTKYSDTVSKQGIFNARGLLTTKAASFKAEYRLVENKLRMVAGFSSSTFNYPDATYISYEFAATYKINKTQILRIVYSRAPRSSTIYDTYVDQTVAYYQSGNKKFTRYAVEGNKNLALLTANMLEVGYRGKLTHALSLDAEIFYIKSGNYNSLVSGAMYTSMIGTDTLEILPITPINLPLTLRQQGVTISLFYNSKKLQAKPFVTIQQSRIKNYAPFLNTPDAPPGPVQPNPIQNNIYSGMGTSLVSKSTPSVFGGAMVNYTATPKLNINLTAYYYSAQTYSHASNIIFNDGIRGIDHIDAKLLLNGSVSYEAAKGLRFSLTGKNLLNDQSHEFFKADKVTFMLLAGMHYEF